MSLPKYIHIWKMACITICAEPVGKLKHQFPIRSLLLLFWSTQQWKGLKATIPLRFSYGSTQWCAQSIKTQADLMAYQSLSSPSCFAPPHTKLLSHASVCVTGKVAREGRSVHRKECPTDTATLILGMGKFTYLSITSTLIDCKHLQFWCSSRRNSKGCVQYSL